MWFQSLQDCTPSPSTEAHIKTLLPLVEGAGHEAGTTVCLCPVAPWCSVHIAGVVGREICVCRCWLQSPDPSKPCPELAGCCWWCGEHRGAAPFPSRGNLHGLSSLCLLLAMAGLVSY